jgi:diguanylate cyclase (GGDEF)-like protein/PAS domain S-box-containing protein
VNQKTSNHSSLLTASLIERSPAVVAIWRNEPDWPLTYISENVRQFGYRAEDFMSARLNYLDLVHPDDHVRNVAELEQHLTSGPDTFRQNYRFRHADGHWIWLDDHTWLIRDEAGKVREIQGVLLDVSGEKRAELMNAAQVRLMQAAEHCEVKDLLQSFLDEAELLTDSSIGFYHFIDEDQTTLELQAWSSNTRKRMCQAVPESTHYPVSRAGVWADAVREKQTVIHNDYAALSQRKGLPDGHARILRELVVPVRREDRIVAILGVGNKASNYNGQDVESVQKLADFAWEIIARKRSQEDLSVRTAELERMAHYDPLTGLPNRVLLADRLEQAMAQSIRRKALLAVAFLDLDDFKPINDLHGHANGDVVLHTVAERLRQALRAGDTVARLGGDEFVIVMLDLDSRLELEHLLQRVLASVTESIQLPDAGLAVKISASIGVTVFPQAASIDADQLIRQADQAMYRAKLDGKNRYRFFA